MLGQKRFSFLGGHAPDLRFAGFVVPTSLNAYCIPVLWIPPSIGLKANVDDSSSSTGAGGGGLVGDVGGNILIAFSSFYGKITNNESEIRAIWDMLVLCEEHGIDVAEVQSDSLHVVLMLQRKISVSWRCYTWWRRILNRFNVCYSHCYREGNFAADYLAKEGGRLHCNQV